MQFLAKSAIFTVLQFYEVLKHKEFEKDLQTYLLFYYIPTKFWKSNCPSELLEFSKLPTDLKIKLVYEAINTTNNEIQISSCNQILKLVIWTIQCAKSKLKWTNFAIKRLFHHILQHVFQLTSRNDEEKESGDKFNFSAAEHRLQALFIFFLFKFFNNNEDDGDEEGDNRLIISYISANPSLRCALQTHQTYHPPLNSPNFKSQFHFPENNDDYNEEEEEEEDDEEDEYYDYHYNKVLNYLICKTQNLKMIKWMILECGIDYHYKTYHQYDIQPIVSACYIPSSLSLNERNDRMHRSHEIVQFLLDRYRSDDRICDISNFSYWNYKTQWPLYVALQYSNIPVVYLLLKEETKLEAINMYWRAVLLRLSHPEMISLLLLQYFQSVRHLSDAADLLICNIMKCYSDPLHPIHLQYSSSSLSFHDYDNSEYDGGGNDNAVIDRIMQPIYDFLGHYFNLDRMILNVMYRCDLKFFNYLQYKFPSQLHSYVQRNSAGNDGDDDAGNVTITTENNVLASVLSSSMFTVPFFQKCIDTFPTLRSSFEHRCSSHFLEIFVHNEKVSNSCVTQLFDLTVSISPSSSSVMINLWKERWCNRFISECLTPVYYYL